MTSQSRRSTHRGRGRRAGTAVAVAALALAALPATGHAATGGGAARPASGQYLVTLSEAPLVTYDGGTAGFAATRPARNGKVDVASSAARRYRAHLEDRQSRLAASVGARAVRHYAVTTDTFTATLTAAQVVRLAAAHGVTSVVPDTLHHLTDDRNSADFLRLTGRDGLWAALGGSASAGRGVVIGDIDTGIWPESPSFAAPALGTAPPPASDPYRPYRTGAATVMRKADGSTFTGVCQTGESFTADLCNRKVVSARYFGTAWLKSVPEANRADYVSPRDGEGHGTHTASTAAGRANVPVTVDGRDLGRVSGVAPGAVVAAYKALWESKDGTQSGGMTSDIVQAIDQATADGVDVINYSVGSSVESKADDPIQTAFRNAAAAGVFVSAAAGNNGPDPATLDNTSPWVTTVAASTVAPYTGTVVLGDGRRYTGVSTTVPAALGPKPLVLAENVRAAGADAASAALCRTGTLEPALVAGKLVVCDRGVNARTEKSAEVARAGGVGMVLVNRDDLSMDADLHGIPTVHLNVPAADTVRAYAATAGATATLAPGGSGIAYPQVAGFSSRGPSHSTGGDVLKPDLAAPGVSILAAVAPPTNGGRAYAFESGTSMATPHISGLAALYLGRYPTWSPMRVKSALMTTATATKGADGRPSKDVFAQGAGQVSPPAMLNPGLVYDSGVRDWLAYLEGLGRRTGSGVAPIDPSDLNYPSIAVGDLLGSQTVTRTVTAVRAGTYRARISAPAGLRVTVSPSTLRFAHAGESRTFTVTFAIGDAPADRTVSGALTWRGAGTAVRSPFVLTPHSARAPERVTGTGARGTVSYAVTPAVRPFTATAYGPVSAAPVPGSVTSHGSSDADAERYFTVPVPKGAKAVEFTARPDDSDAQVALVAGKLVGGKWTSAIQVVLPTPDAVVSLPHPESGDYLVAVVTLGDAPGTSATPFTFQSNVVGGKAAGGRGAEAPGSLRVSPARSSGAVGTPVTLTADWSGVGTRARTTGWVEYPNGAGTVVSLN
uniref:S8 family serine peptidase n=1 Tax=Streptomyces corallincola TaxID=2851888 RepID=UPI0027E31FCE|nr:S8 family serine peptidase [Streptomyces corallincola]